MSIFDSIVELFDHHQIKYQFVHHESVVTCDDAARVRGTRPEQGAKALVVFADKVPQLLVLPCARKLDFKAFKIFQNVRDLRMATPDEVFNLTSLKVGSIPPLGNVLKLPTFVDEELLREEKICFNAADHCISIIMSSQDYLTLVNPTVGNFTTPKL